MMPTLQRAPEPVSFAPGETVLYPGASQCLYRVRSGLVRLFSLDEAGGGMTLRYVKPGGFFGEEALLGARRSYFAEAVAPTDLERLTPDGVDARQLAALSLHLISVVTDLYGGLRRSAAKPLRARIAAELLVLRDSALAASDASGTSTVFITHDELATSVGSVRETVTKTVGELARSGAIEAGYGKLRLLDLDILQHLADN